MAVAIPYRRFAARSSSSVGMPERRLGSAHNAMCDSISSRTSALAPLAEQASDGARHAYPSAANGAVRLLDDSANTARNSRIHWGFYQGVPGTPTIPATRNRRPRPGPLFTGATCGPGGSRQNRTARRCDTAPEPTRQSDSL